ncbi:hypothetical protein ABIE11_004062 [Lelliottia sp. 489]|uniref:hypothetical protein n=1 Tax=Lelliottia sp. 489 TaxID=3156448 RepID=UPI003D25192B
MNDFCLVVELYRLSNHPYFDGDKFSACLDFTTTTKSLFEKLYNINPQFGSLDDVEVDGTPCYATEDFPEAGKKLEFTFKVNQGSANRFYKKRSDFVKIHTLKKGMMPDFYYIVEDNYYSTDNQKPLYIQKIESICNLIFNLSKLAHFHDIKHDSKGTFFRLVFVLHSESKSTSIVIETNFSEDVVDDNIINLDLIRSLVSLESSADIHYIEKVNTFRNTIIEYVERNGNSFSEIIKNWDDICQLYSNNLASYMSAFSFHKARKEVVDAEIEYSEKLSKIISDISSKALAIPISLAASLAIFKLTTNSEWIITFAGVIITAVISSAMLLSQKKQLERISHSKDVLFKQLNIRIKDDTTDLKCSLQEVIEKLNDNETFCRNVLDCLLSLAWMPTCVGIVGIFLKFMPPVH